MVNTSCNFLPYYLCFFIKEQPPTCNAKCTEDNYYRNQYTVKHSDNPSEWEHAIFRVILNSASISPQLTGITLRINLAQVLYRTEEWHFIHPCVEGALCYLISLSMGRTDTYMGILRSHHSRLSIARKSPEHIYMFLGVAVQDQPASSPLGVIGVKNQWWSHSAGHGIWIGNLPVTVQVPAHRATL